MPNVRGGGQIPQQGYHTRDQIEKTSMPSKGRDDIEQAFAGDENQFAGKDPQATNLHSTNVKNRKTRKSKEKAENH